MGLSLLPILQILFICVTWCIIDSSTISIRSRIFYTFIPTGCSFTAESNRSHRIPSNALTHRNRNPFCLNVFSKPNVENQYIGGYLNRTHTQNDVSDDPEPYVDSRIHPGSTISLHDRITDGTIYDQKYNEEARNISTLCSYEDNPRLLKQIQSRLNKYEALRKKFNINPFPEVASRGVYDQLSKVVSENKHLKNGEEVDRFYRVFGRVNSVRFDGHFMHIVNVNKEFQDYASYDVFQDTVGNFTSLQVMFRLEDPIELDRGHSESKSDYQNQGLETFLCRELVNLVDIGDLLELYGNVKKTNLGEITIVPRRIKFLSKCFIPLPNKQHGLKDVETRFRLRHLDLLTNQNSRFLLLKRFHVIAKIRQFLNSRDYVEVDTPILQHYNSGDLAQPFETMFNRLEQTVKLRVAPEFSLKKIFMGLPLTKVYEIGKCFRNEGISLTHSPEFTMIEIYEKMADHNAMIGLLEDLVNHVVSFNPLNTDKANLNPNVLNQKKEHYETVYEVRWVRKNFKDLVQEYTGIDVTMFSKSELGSKLKSLNEKFKADKEEETEGADSKFETWAEVANEIFETFVVPKLTYPIHVTHLPSDISPLCYYDTTNAPGVDGASAQGQGECRLFSNRFESYLGGMEVANGCTEQCNPLILAEKLVGNENLKSDAATNSQSDGVHSDTDPKASAKDRGSDFDREFLHASFCGMEPMAGLGIGIDRLVMYLTRTKNIKEIQPLPSIRKL